MIGACCKIMVTAMAALAWSSCASAGSIQVGGQTLKSRQEIDDYIYSIFGGHINNAITSKTMTKLELNKIEGKFAFISPPEEIWRERYMWVSGLLKPDLDSQLMIGYSEKIKSEMIFFYFEKMGLVDFIDIIDEKGFTADVAANYDYVITINSDFNGKRDARSANTRKTRFVVKNLKNGKEQLITEATGSPMLVSLFEPVAVKFSDAVKATK